MKNLFDEVMPVTPKEIIANVPNKPANNIVLLAFSGGNDSRTLAHVIKPIFAEMPYQLELAAIETGLQMDGWKQSVLDFAEWIGLPVSFWTGEGKARYEKIVTKGGFPGNSNHGMVQGYLKGRAFRKMRRHYGRGVWILSGVRKLESRKRQRLNSPYSDREGVFFISPIFYWTNAQVMDYMDENNIPLAPGVQWDCKCGATVKDVNSEWADIERNAPCLREYLLSLEDKNPMPWKWGSFDVSAHKQLNK